MKPQSQFIEVLITILGTVALIWVIIELLVLFKVI